MHARQRDEQEKLAILNAETSGVVLLSPEQEKECQDDLAAKQKQAVLAGEWTETGKVITWLANIADLEKEIVALAAEATKLDAATQALRRAGPVGARDPGCRIGRTASRCGACESSRLTTGRL